MKRVIIGLLLLAILLKTIETVLALGALEVITRRDNYEVPKPTIFISR